MGRGKKPKTQGENPAICCNKQGGGPPLDAAMEELAAPATPEKKTAEPDPES